MYSVDVEGKARDVIRGAWGILGDNVKGVRCSSGVGINDRLSGCEYVEVSLEE